ncbi:hypothetical protein GCM10009843_21660 [Nocardioides bigeumensis]|uniref:TNase-like domain-containing protein n=2 Tax=Nocardioides bigeumensis TaxID=433657 RepID=A0ABN2YCH1_9ACTN
MDCGDFPSQRAAQIYFLNHGGPASDPDNLDSDGDGIACESNPCPCFTGSNPPQPSPSPSPNPQPAPAQKVIVTKVIDGDRVRVKYVPGGSKATVSLLGTRAPKLNKCGGIESKRALKKVTPVGTRVQLIPDKKQRNKNGKGDLLRYVHKGKKDVNRQQLVKGWSELYVAKGKLTRQRSYARAEKVARQGSRGNWFTC